MLVIPLWFIFQRKNWARWLFVVYGLVGAYATFPYLLHPVQSHASSWLLRWLVINLIAIAGLAALFLPSATNWFRANDDAQTA